MSRFTLIIAVLVVVAFVASRAAPARRKSIDDRIEKVEKEFEKKHGKGRRRGKGHLTELDILLPDDLFKKHNKKGGRSKRNALRYTNYHWPGAQVNYQIADHYSSSEISTIEAALNRWRTLTCLKFTNVGAANVDKIFMNKTGGCYSWVGMQGGTQEMSLANGCVTVDTIIHEVGHAIGYFHEQSRPDRDEYITIHEENVQPNRMNNFKSYGWDVLNNHTVGYDYRSIMHYGQYFFTANGKKTITTKDPAFQNVIGTVEDLSYGDVKMANLMYKCASHCGAVACPNGFVDKNCVCQCSGGSPVTPCSGGTAAPTTAPPGTAAPTTEESTSTTTEE